LDFNMVLVSAALPPEHTTQSEHMSYAVLCGAYVLRSCGHKSTVDDRLAYIQRKQLCSNCFASSHQLRDCTSAHNCLTCQDRCLRQKRV